jgi:hypothetical protein
MHQGSRSVTMAVPPAEVWGLLVAPGRRGWYYRLTPRGDFVRGEHVDWLDGRGEVLEESDVVEVQAPRRLVLRGRFKFAPRFAEDVATRLPNCEFHLIEGAGHYSLPIRYIHEILRDLIGSIHHCAAGPSG